MNKDSQVDPHAPRTAATCDLCEHRRVSVQWPAGVGTVYDYGPFNAHRSCFNEWHHAQGVQK